MATTDDEKFEIIAIRRQGNICGMSAVLTTSIKGVKFKVTLDTGAALTIFSRNIFAKLPKDIQAKLKPCPKVRLEAADGNLMQVDGIVELHLEIGKCVYPWKIYIAPITDTGLLGFDFFYYYDCAIEARRGIRINGRWIKCEIQNAPQKTSKVTVAEDIEILPYSECVIKGKADFSDFVSHNGIIEPHPHAKVNENLGNSDRSQLIIGCTLVDTQCEGKPVPVRIMNITQESVYLHAGTVVGLVSEVDDVELIAETEMDSDELTAKEVYSACTCKYVNTDSDDCHDSPANLCNDNWTENLKDLYKRSCELLNVHECKKLRDLLDNYQNCFAKSPTDLGKTSIIQHSIDTGDASPIKSAPRRPPMAFAGEEEKFIQQQLEAGIITESTSPWASALVFVKKKDGSTRGCVDYRRINDVTLNKNAHPLPKIRECLDCLGDAKWFSTLDLQSGYHQIEVKESDRPKTAFVSSRGGLYEFSTLPFGLCGAPATFQRCMEMVFRNLTWKTVLVYMDDIIIFSPSFATQLQRLESALQRLSDAGLKLKPSKCHLFKREVTFLGHLITQDGVKTDPAKVEVIQNWPTPKNITEVRSFVGLCSYYRRFIEGFARLASPLHNLMKVGVEFVWSDACQEAFDALKAALTGENIMAYPNDKGLFIVDTDASNTAIGATISQLQFCDKSQKDEERPIAYASKSLTKTQRRYCVTRRELLAVVAFIWEFRHYLLGRQFIVRTDHSALRWIMTFKEPEGQVARWIEILSRFHFKIIHRNGLKHLNADSLSRIPCDPDDCDCYDGQTVVEDLPCGGCDKCKTKHNKWSNFNDVDDIVPLSTRCIRYTLIDNEESEQNSTCNSLHANSINSLNVCTENPMFTTTSADRTLPTSNHSNCLTNSGCRQAPDTSPVTTTPAKDITTCCAPSTSKSDLIRTPAKNVSSTKDKFTTQGRVISNCIHESDAGTKHVCFEMLAKCNNCNMPIEGGTLLDPIHQCVNNNGQSQCQSQCTIKVRAVKPTDVHDANDGTGKNDKASWVDGYTSEDIVKMQENDSDLKHIMKWLKESPIRPNREHVHALSPATRHLWLLWDQLVLVNGVLYKRWVGASDGSDMLLLVVPNVLQKKVIYSLHNPVTSGHLGIKKTLSKLKRLFYWRNMKDSVTNWIKRCATCGARKRPAKTPKAELKNYCVGAPMDRVCTDILGPLPISDQGNKYILVVGDHFTRWVEAYAIPDQTAATVATKIVYEFFSRLGLPLELHSDQGKNYESNLFKEVCKLLDITKTRSTPYHAMSNGFIERMNLTLVNLISAYVDDDQREWDRHLPLLMAAYRACVHEATGYSPNLLMLGREVHTPVNLLFGDALRPEQSPETESEYVTNLSERMTRIYALTREHLHKAGNRQKRDYDARIAQNNYEAGDLVYFFDDTKQKGKSPKLNPKKWVGPCVITKKLSDLLFEVCSKQKGRRRVLHHNRLKPYESDEIPNWIRKLQKLCKTKENNSCNTPKAQSKISNTESNVLRRSPRNKNK